MTLLGAAKVSHFPHRTLQIFLGEMRSALNKEAADAVTAHKILDDLEYVAANLQSPASASREGGGGGRLQLMQAETVHQDQLIARLKREHESHQQEAKDLKM